MQLTLVVPGLLDVAASAAADAASATLARLLATGLPAAPHDGAAAIACAALSIPRQRDWPVAPLLAAAANLECGDEYWLVAEPVTLIVTDDDVRLAGVVDDLSAGEADALLATLDSHFAGDGLRFFPLRPARWLIASARWHRLDTHPADEALGAALFPFLPGGPDAPRWRRWQSEMQMLLFEHPVNAARERLGRRPANGVWLSYGGRCDEARPPPRIASLYADAALPRDLARACGVAAAARPASLGAWRAASPGSPSMVWLDDIDGDDASVSLAALDRDWAAPLATALAGRAIDEVAVVLTGRYRALWFAPRQRSLVARLRQRLAPARLSDLLADRR